MAGLYIHVPFCQSKCRYCDFASFVGQEKNMKAYAARLAEEMNAYRGRVFDTVFLGGGTPSCLPPPFLATILDAMQSCFRICEDAEITCEMNPGTVTEAFLRVLKDNGFNRVSMGMQAKQEALLQTLGRTHRFEDVAHSVSLCQKAGFQNINVDLMFGIPGQTVQNVLASIKSAIALGVTHISCYGLIVEENTPIQKDILSGALVLPDEEAEREMYDAAIRLLAKNGFEQYEISNFAISGHECRHNIGYWQQEPYLGVGLAAHSMENDVRFCNTGWLDDYLAGQGVVEREPIALVDRQFETLMLGLRMTRGISLEAFEKRHGVPFESVYGEKARALEAKGLVAISNGFLRLTRRGMDVQNAVLVELMG